MFKATREFLGDKVHHYTITRDGTRLSYAGVLDLWKSDAAFNAFFTTMLSESPFSAFRWETPPISRVTAGRQFECVLLEAPHLLFPPDPHSFARRFADDETDAGVVTFENLGGDATLVVPSPRGDDAVYAHLAAFLRSAPQEQQQALWRALGQAVAAKLSDRALWISTHGGGVAWVHVRLDSRPKYYGHAPYRELAN
jgi:hypothetical protein